MILISFFKSSWLFHFFFCFFFCNIYFLKSSQVGIILVMQLFAGKKKTYSFVPWESVHFWLAFTRIVKQIVENNRHFFFHLYTLQSQSHLQCLLEIFAGMDSCMHVYMHGIFVYHPWLGYRDLYRTHFSTNTDIFTQKQK